jgi:excisionase family DNA binding protein
MVVSDALEQAHLMEYPSLASKLRARDSLMSVAEFKKLLGVDQQTIYEWVWQGKVPAVRIGNRVKFDPRSVAAWLDARTTGITRRRKTPDSDASALQGCRPLQMPNKALSSRCLNDPATVESCVPNSPLRVLPLRKCA